MQINLNLSDKWQSLNSKESCYLQGHIFNIEEKKSAIYSAHNIENWANVQNHLNGFYSLVKLKEDTLFAAVDHIRSYPLFYAQSDSNFYLSDSAEWIRKQLDLTVMDGFAKAEFQLTGYVTGDATLYKPIRQLQAGECLLLSDGQVILKRYYTFTHTEPTHYDKELLLEQLNHAAKLSIRNLIDYADGRQIVIPLSGGYDSRLIATLLKEADYDNILTFTYGTKGSKEAQYSKIVADSLGLKWHFIEYTKELWQAVWDTDSRKQYQLTASNWVSLPHIQDWLAISILKKDNIVSPDAIFAPGHCCVTSFLPQELHSDVNWDLQKGVENLINTHFNLLPINKLSSNTYSEENLRNKLKKYLENSDNNELHTSKIMQFNWQERQSKFIGNSVRVYEHFDFQWWMPLWDKSFLSFWERIPFYLRVNRELYISYVQSKYLENSITENTNNITNASEKPLIIQRLFRLSLVHRLKDNPLTRRVYFVVNQKKNPVLRESVYSSKTINRLIRKGITSNGRAALLFLKEFE